MSMSMRPVYEESEVTTALQILLEMRDGNSANKAKYDALNLAMDAISNKTVPVAPVSIQNFGTSLLRNPIGKVSLILGFLMLAEMTLN